MSLFAANSLAQYASIMTVSSSSLLDGVRGEKAKRVAFLPAMTPAAFGEQGQIL